MIDYLKVPTSKEVFYAILSTHTELLHHPIYLDKGDKVRICTLYRFNNVIYPIIEVETVYETNNKTLEVSAKYKYWICLPIIYEEE